VDGNYISSKGEMKEDYGELSEISRYLSKNLDHTEKGFVGSIGEYLTKAYWDEIRGAKYRHISNESAEEFLDYWEKQKNINDASDSWFNTSASDFDNYWDCDGWENLNWKDKGYKT
jgi:hypothetical protein